MINLVSAVENKTLEIADEFAENAVKIAKGNAPHDSGHLIASINTYKTSKWSYIVTTDARGSNKFEYPARIEAGEEVHPNQKRQGWAYQPRAIWYHGTWHNMARASAQSGFMEKTMGMLHI